MTQAPPLPFRLAVNQPFCFAHTLAFLNRFPAMTGEQELGENSLTYAVREAATPSACGSAATRTACAVR